MTVGSRSDESRDTLGFKFDVTDMSIPGVGVFYYSATTSPPVYRIDPEGNGIVIAEWVPDRPEGVTVRRFDEYGRVTRASTIGAELRPIPSEVKREFVEEGMKKAEGPYESARRMGERVPREPQGRGRGGTHPARLLRARPGHAGDARGACLAAGDDHAGRL